MPLVWITGNSGAGKSAVAEALRERGFAAVDADDEFCRWADRVTGQELDDPPYPVPKGWLDRFGWVISRALLEEAAADAGSDVVLLCGSAENEADVRDLFNLIVALVIDDDTLRRRLIERTSNAFGRNPEELAASLVWNPRMRPLYERIGAKVVDATQPLDVVVDEVLEHAHAVGPVARLAK